MLFIMLMIVMMAWTTDASKIRLYSGARPTFEKYEDYIMGRLVSSNDMINYSFRMKPEDYDYESLDFNKIDRNRMTVLSGHRGLAKRTPGYDQAAKTAKELFDKEIDRRIELTKPLRNQYLIVTFGLIAGTIVIMILSYKAYKKNLKNRYDFIEKNKFKILPVKLIGREEQRRYRGHTSYYLEVQPIDAGEDEEFDKLYVSSRQHENFKSQRDAFVVKLDDEYGFYDTYDVVWEKM